MSRIGQTLCLGFLLVSHLVVGAGCGYRSVMPGASSSRTAAGETSAGGASSLADADRPARLAVLAIRNDSPEPWLDRILGDALRREMGLRAGFDLVNDPRQAELILRGRIRPLATQSNSFSSFVAALEFSVTMELDLEVVRASGLVVRLDPRMLSESELYLASADIEITRTNRLEALRHLSDVLASRVADTLELMEAPIPDSIPAPVPTSAPVPAPPPAPTPSASGEAVGQTTGVEG